MQLEKIIRDIRNNHYAICTVSSELVQTYSRILDLFGDISAATKDDFCFFDETDGFLPFGKEYSMVPEQLDLCERFCYWVARRSYHKQYDFAASEFYRAIAQYEEEISAIAQQVMDALCNDFLAPRQHPIRQSSYLQFCVYPPDYQTEGREFLQDPHEDGHLLSFIKPSCEGLILIDADQSEPVKLAHNQMIVLSGSLLQELSDGAIPAQLHAVKNPLHPIMRMSMMYFVNPDFTRESISFKYHRSIDLKALADQRHRSFGNAGLSFSEKRSQKL